MPPEGRERGTISGRGLRLRRATRKRSCDLWRGEGVGMEVWSHSIAQQLGAQVNTVVTVTPMR